MKLRWVETEPYTDRSVPVAMIPGYPESGPTYYKLQQWVEGEWVDIEIEGENILTASEALYGFMGWLTSRKEVVTLSASNDAPIAADLVKQFCETNNLPECRENWTEFLTHPPKP